MVTSDSTKIRMSKRSADASDSSDSSQCDEEESGRKRRKVEFEPVRLVSISSVNDIHERINRGQLVKLAEVVRLKDKLLRNCESEKERLRQRQETDENTCCTINRHWNNMDESLRSIIRTIVSTSESPVENVGISVNFLTELVEMSKEQIEASFDKRMKSTVTIVNQLQQELSKRSAENLLFSRKIASYVSSEASTSEKVDDRKMIQDLSRRYSKLSEDNLRLQKEVSRCHAEQSKLRIEKSQLEDRNEQLVAKAEELQTEVDDARFDMQKAYRKVYKFENKLHCLVKEKNQEISKMKANGQTNGSSTANHTTKASSPVCDSKELEKIKFERDEQAELASKRLNEITELNLRVQKLTSENASLKCKSSVITYDEITSSKEYQTLQTYYSAMKNELDRTYAELDEAIVDREELRASLITIQNETKVELETTYRRVMETNEEMNSNTQQVKGEYDMLRMEFEQSLLQHDDERSVKKEPPPEVKTIIDTVRTQNFNLKRDLGKYKNLYRSHVSQALQARRERDDLRRKLENGVLIELDNDVNPKYYELTLDKLLQEPDNEANPLELRERITKLIKTIVKMRSDHMEGGTVDTEELSSLRNENAKMVDTIRFLGAENRAERQKYFETETKVYYKEKLDELEQLKKEKERMEEDEKALSEELDSIGQALEELQEQNGTLITQKREKEDQVLKMMNERVATVQLHQKLKEEILHLENLKNGQQKELKILQSTNARREEALILTKEITTSKTEENLKLMRKLESEKKMVLELGLMKDELLNKYEKLEAQSKKMQEMLSTKSSEHEAIQQKMVRTREKLDTARKRLDRALKTENLGSTDAVLNEEIRQLRDSLMCSACKLRSKDAILTKCFHIFCMECLKKRYDTRQRKCPKCNANFGANDFHRIYLS